MTLTEFHELITTTVEYAGETAPYVTVRVMVGDDEYEVAEVRHLSVKPDVWIVAEKRGAG